MLGSIRLTSLCRHIPARASPWPSPVFSPAGASRAWLDTIIPGGITSSDAAPSLSPHPAAAGLCSRWETLCWLPLGSVTKTNTAGRGKPGGPSESQHRPGAARAHRPRRTPNLTPAPRGRTKQRREGQTAPARCGSRDVHRVPRCGGEEPSLPLPEEEEEAAAAFLPFSRP